MGTGAGVGAKETAMSDDGRILVRLSKFRWWQ